VGRATTRAVVISSVTILVTDYFLTTWILEYFVKEGLGRYDKAPECSENLRHPARSSRRGSAHPKGKITVIIGRSGTGKSVLLKHMIGLLKPDAGEVVVEGTDIGTLSSQDLTAFRRKFGFLFRVRRFSTL
jgi:ABC-type multidrug transport system fused ATPase/permease subunit